jgi:membrane peptidoglycan carboxypeptidase
MLRQPVDSCCHISQDQMDAALAEKLIYHAPINSFYAPHFVDFVLEELRQLGFKPGLQQLNVKTTLNYEWQRIGENVVRANLDHCLAPPSCDPNGKLSSGLVAEDPHNGEILVMVGSPDYNAQGGQYNWTTQPRNVGSSVKPYTYAAVINARAATVDTPVYDGPSPLVYKDAYSTTQFYNYDKRSHGVLPLKQAMGNSLNICAVKVELSIGVPAVLAFMRNIGVQPRYINNDGSYNTQAPADEYGPSVTLGGYPITLLEHVGGMATLADMGVYHTPEAILQVTDSKGQLLYQTHADQRARQAIDPGVAFIMAQIMSDDHNRQMIFGPGSPLHFSDRIVAAKTGTSDDFKDASTVGFTPDLAVAIWIGDILDIHHTMVQGSDGVFVATPGFHSFLATVLGPYPGDRWYSQPADVVAGPNNSWYLTDTTSISRLPGDNPPSPTPTPINITVPPDPLTGPVLASPTPVPLPSPSPRPSP